MSKQCWIVTLEVIQKCDEDMLDSEFHQWIEEYFQGCDYGAVRCLEARLQPVSTVTFDVSHCPSMYGLRLTLEALIGQTDTSSVRWSYKVILNSELWAMLERIGANFSCSVDQEN